MSYHDVPPDHDTSGVRGGGPPDEAEGATAASADFPAGDSGDAVEEVRLDPSTTPELLEAAGRIEEPSSRRGFWAGVLCLVLGTVIVILGASGTVTWDFTGGGLSSKLQTSAIGVVLWIVGLLLIVLTRPKITITGGSGRRA